MPRGRPVALLAASIVCGLAVACSSLSSAPIATKDRVIHDVDATDLPPQPDADLPPDSPFAPVESSTTLGTEYDAYAVLTICAPKSAADAAPQQAGATSSDAGATGACEPMPSACENEPDCLCLFHALAAEIPCEYPHCSMDDGFKLYCP
jgi:hypothetical protein